MHWLSKTPECRSCSPPRNTRARILSRPGALKVVDAEDAANSASSTQRRLIRRGAANIAYVIYTSGSTGKPKGVMVENRNVVNFFTGMDRAIGCKPGVWLAVTSVSFDISVLELLWTLTRGFTVVLHGDEGPDAIADEITRHDVTHLQMTPSLARMLTLDPRGLAALARSSRCCWAAKLFLLALIRPSAPGLSRRDSQHVWADGDHHLVHDCHDG